MIMPSIGSHDQDGQRRNFWNNGFKRVVVLDASVRCATVSQFTAAVVELLLLKPLEECKLLSAILAYCNHESGSRGANASDPMTDA